MSSNLANITENLKPSICLDMCGLNQKTLDYCNGLWKHLDTPIIAIFDTLKLPQIHLILVGILVGCFILSIIEIFMEAMCKWTPYKKLYLTCNFPGFVRSNVADCENPSSDVTSNQQEIEMSPLAVTS